MLLVQWQETLALWYLNDLDQGEFVAWHARDEEVHGDLTRIPAGTDCSKDS